MTVLRVAIIGIAVAAIGYVVLPTEVPPGITVRETDESAVRMLTKDSTERMVRPRQAQQDFLSGGLGFPPDQRLVVEDSAGQRGSIDPLDAPQAFKNGDFLVGAERVVRPPISHFGTLERVQFMPGYALIATAAVMVAAIALLNWFLRKYGM